MSWINDMYSTFTDYAIMGDRSRFSALVDQHIKEGMSLKDATGAAAFESFVQQPIEQGADGGITAAILSLKGTYQNNANLKANQALQIPETGGARSGGNETGAGQRLLTGAPEGAAQPQPTNGIQRLIGSGGCLIPSVPGLPGMPGAYSAPGSYGAAAALKAAGPDAETLDNIDSGREIGDNINDNNSGNKKVKSTEELLKETKCSSDDLYRYIKNIDKNAAEEYFKSGKWPDGVQIPKSPDVLNPDGTIDWTKVPKGGYILDSNGNAIKQPYTPFGGEIIDRFGPSDGRYTSPVNDGKPYTYDQRSLPYIEDQSQYHKYIIKDDLSKIQDYVKRCTDPVLIKEIEEYVDYWYNGDYSKAIVYTGEIAKVDGFGIGGGIQYELPIPIDWLVQLHLLEEIY